MKKLMVSGAILLVAGLVQAGTVPALVNYQGRLTDESGTPLATADYALRFEVWSDPVAGTRVWGPLCFDVDPGGTPTDGHKFKVPVVQGYFNVVLDRDTGYDDCAGTTYEDPPAPVTDAFSEDSRYVEIAVWNDGTSAWESILPRQQVLSAPYAARAELSHTAHEVVCDESTTKIAVTNSVPAVVDVVTVDDTGVDVTGDLDVSLGVECDGLTVLGNASVASDLGVVGNLQVGGAFHTAGGTDKPIFFSYFVAGVDGVWDTGIPSADYNVGVVGFDSHWYRLDATGAYEQIVIQPIKVTGTGTWFVRVRFEGVSDWPNPAFYIMAVSTQLSEWRCWPGADNCDPDNQPPTCATCVHGSGGSCTGCYTSGGVGLP